MIVKSEGIVLQAIRHTDAAIVVNIFTRDYGMLGFVVQGVHSRRSRKKNVYFQPLSLLDLEIYYRKGKNLHSIKEVSPLHAGSSIINDPLKSTLAFFIGEVLRKCLAEDDPNLALWEFVKGSIEHLESTSSVSNFHIAFLVRLSVFLGIAPELNTTPGMVYFDMVNGTFTQSPPLHGFYFDREPTLLLKRFIASTLDESSGIALNGIERSKFLEQMVHYFSLHLEGMKRIKSLEILQEVFR